MKKGLTELVFIVDRSGSMAGLEKDTIGGFNSCPGHRSGTFQYRSADFSPAFRGQGFGIVEALNRTGRIQDHSSSHQRPGARPTSRLIDPGDRAEPSGRQDVLIKMNVLQHPAGASMMVASAGASFSGLGTLAKVSGTRKVDNLSKGATMATAAPTTLFMGTKAAAPAFPPTRVSRKWHRESAEAFR